MLPIQEKAGLELREGPGAGRWVRIPRCVGFV
jgi:hypothetical protein